MRTHFYRCIWWLVLATNDCPSDGILSPRHPSITGPIWSNHTDSIFSKCFQGETNTLAAFKPHKLTRSESTEGWDPTRWIGGTWLTGHPKQFSWEKCWENPWKFLGFSQVFSPIPQLLVADGHISWQCTCRQPWPPEASLFGVLVSRHWPYSCLRLPSVLSNVLFFTMNSLDVFPYKSKQKYRQTHL